MFSLSGSLFTWALKASPGHLESDSCYCVCHLSSRSFQFYLSRGLQYNPHLRDGWTEAQKDGVTIKNDLVVKSWNPHVLHHKLEPKSLAQGTPPSLVYSAVKKRAPLKHTRGLLWLLLGRLSVWMGRFLFLSWPCPWFPGCLWIPAWQFLQSTSSSVAAHGVGPLSLTRSPEVHHLTGRRT